LRSCGKLHARAAPAAGFEHWRGHPRRQEHLRLPERHHSFGETEEQAGEYAEELAAEMLATTLDVDFDPDKSWTEKKEIYRISTRLCAPATVRSRRWVTSADCGRPDCRGRLILEE